MTTTTPERPPLADLEAAHAAAWAAYIAAAEAELDQEQTQ